MKLPATVTGLWLAALAGPIGHAGEAAPAAPAGPAAARDIRVVSDRWPDGSSLKRFAADAVRLSGAKTEKEQALAVFRWMRRWTMFTSGKAPAERGRPVLDELKILHVYGAHWCDGRALCMENLWRAHGGRAMKLYVPEGYTMATVFWQDDDGVGRWHQMHCSRGWYLYDRDGRFVAHPDQIGADMSLMFRPSRTGAPRSGFPPRPWNWIAVGHRRFSGHDISLDLRPGEGYSRQWGNEGVPLVDNIAKEQYADGEHGPYEITYGNGRMSGVLPLGEAAAGGGRRELVWPVRLPHVLADAWLEGPLPKGFSARLATGKVGEAELPAPGGERLELGRKCSVRDGVAGLYAYTLRLSWPEGEKPPGELRLVNVVQHNIFSLPQLWPGRNRITVSAALPKGLALRVTYEWDDPAGKARRSVAVVEAAPWSYEIVAGGGKWEDVVCRKLTVECQAATGGGNRLELREATAEFTAVPAPKPTDEIVGEGRLAPLKSVAEHVKDLAGEDEPTVIAALDALAVLRDAAAAPALTEMIYSDRKLKVEIRGRAMQALRLSLPPEKAFDALLPVVRRDERVKWAGEDGGEGWKTLSSLVAHLAGQSGYRPAIPDLVAAYNRGVGPWNRMTYLRAFGRLKAKEALQPCIDALRQHSDVSSSAAWALGEIGDSAAAPALIKAAEARLVRENHQATLIAEAAEALGKLGARTPEALGLLERLLGHGDEEVRGAAALALGRVGGAEHAGKLRAAAAAEGFDWVKKRMLEAADRLK